MKISIVTVCYNCADQIARTVNSVAAQDYADIEYIVVDGGSTDGTLDFLQTVKDRISILISEPDDGLYDAMNKAVSAGSGEYIYFLNAGDAFVDSMVVSDLHRIIANSAAQPQLLSGRIEFSLDGRGLGMYRPEGTGWEGPGLPHQATLVHRSLQQKYPFDSKLKYVGDYEFWRRVKEDAAFSIVFTERVIALFDLGGVSTSPEHELKRLLERAYVNCRLGGQFGYAEWARIGISATIKRVLHFLFGPYTQLKLLRLYRKVRIR